MQQVDISIALEELISDVKHLIAKKATPRQFHSACSAIDLEYHLSTLEALLKINLPQARERRLVLHHIDPISLGSVYYATDCFKVERRLKRG